MKQSKFSESKIVNILKKAEAGVSVEDLSRQPGFSKASFYKWKAKYGGMSISETDERTGRREPSVEADVCKPESGTRSTERYYRKKTLQVRERRELASYAIQEFGLSERQACRTVQVSRCAYHHQPKKITDKLIAQELRQLAEKQPPSSASTAPTEKRFWIRICLMISRRFVTSLNIGWKTTTPFVRTRHYRVYHPASLYANLPRFVHL